MSDYLFWFFVGYLPLVAISIYHAFQLDNLEAKIRALQFQIDWLVDNAIPWDEEEDFDCYKSEE